METFYILFLVLVYVIISVFMYNKNVSENFTISCPANSYVDPYTGKCKCNSGYVLNLNLGKCVPKTR